MTRPFRILCALDARLPAAAAFEQALAMSVPRRAQLVVVHAVAKNDSFGWGSAERATVLAGLRERAEALQIPVIIRVQQGDPAEIILLHARAQVPDLIVLGAHDPSGFARLRFGSIADRVVRDASCPVLLVPAAARHPVASFRRVICAMDLSSRSPMMIANAARFVGDGVHVSLLHVPHAAADDARGRLQAMLDTLHVNADVVVSGTGTPIDAEILRVVTATDADLVVIGATRKGGLSRRLLGSTAIKVSRRSPVPVLILPAVHDRRTLTTLDESVLGWAA